jgi:hydroxypyruvate reductase
MNIVHKDLMSIYQAGLEAVKGSIVVQKALQKSLFSGVNFHVVAIGKAADSMLQGVPDNRIMSAILISKHGHISAQSKQKSSIQCVESDHPIPKQASLNAGKKLLDYLNNLPAEEPCLFLISGGTSSLVEVLEEGWGLSELTELTTYLLANAYPINEINAIRRRVSKIKGGSLWAYLGEREVSCLLISDVPKDNPADIGSGLLFFHKQSQLPNIPKHWGDKIKLATQQHPASEIFYWEIIASLDIAKKSAGQCAETLGYDVQLMTDFLEGNASDVAENCIKKLKKHSNQLFIWGGETTVQLPRSVGKGGRNQHLALAASIAMQGEQEVYLLAAGTDGSDGVTNATGALVSHTTAKKGAELGLEASDYLRRADSYSYFNQTGELVVTGATGTNVMDLLIGISKV